MKLFSVLVLREEEALIVYRVLLESTKKIHAIILIVIVFTAAAIADNRVPSFNTTRRVAPLARGSDRLKCRFLVTFCGSTKSNMFKLQLNKHSN